MEDPGLGDLELHSMFYLVGSLKITVKQKKVYYRQFVDSLFQPVQTLFWSETCIFGENNNKAEHFTLNYQASYKYQAERPAASALRRGDTVINDRIERCCYC